MTINIYGIKNCDTMKKAFAWLKAEGLNYEFHDYKQQVLTPELLNTFIDALGYEAMINKRGTTWRNLDETTKDALNETSAKALMLANPSLIKRPLLVYNNHHHLGFKPELYAQIF